MAKKSNIKRLAAFDFDQTIVAEAAGAVIYNRLDKKFHSDKLKSLLANSLWLHLMQEIIILLYKCHIKKDKIIKMMCDIKEVEGMINCIKILHENNFDIIIISDANTEFIDYWLKFNNIYSLIKKVYTNPAYFNDSEYLVVKPYQQQYSCEMCAVNLCKGKILIKHIEENKFNYNHVYFIGDGIIDICPMLKLKEKDYGFMRKNFECDKEILNYASKYSKDINCQLTTFRTGYDLVYKILNTFMDSNEVERKYQLKKMMTR